jgi:hypothetical protein
MRKRAVSTALTLLSALLAEAFFADEINPYVIFGGVAIQTFIIWLWPLERLILRLGLALAGVAVIVGAALIVGANAASAEELSEPEPGLSAATAPRPTYDCPSTVGQPVLMVRNFFGKDAKITGIWANQYSGYNTKVNRFLSVGNLIGGNTNLLGKKVLEGVEMPDALGSDDDSPTRCGYPISFAQFGYPKTCSANPLENTYQVTIEIERAGIKHTLTVARNACDESMLDVVPGTPSDDSEKLQQGQGISGSLPDCKPTQGEPRLLVRNLIEGTEIVSMKARPAQAGRSEGVQVLNHIIKAKPFSAAVNGEDSGRCGTSVNFNKPGLRADCPENKLLSLYMLDVTFKRGDKKYSGTFTRDVCGETVLDFVPGTPAKEIKVEASK